MLGKLVDGLFQSLNGGLARIMFWHNGRSDQKC